MPIPVVTVEEMRSWERQSWEAGAREDDVIRQVGHCVAGTVREGTRPGSRILVLAGRGNNGADALAAVPPLAQDFRIETLRILSPSSQRDELARALEARPDLILDGLFGIGLNRDLDLDWVDLIRQVNESGPPILALDVPSGLDADTGLPRGAAIRATTTLTVGAPKVGLLHPEALPFVGRLEVAHPVGLVGSPTGASQLQWTLAEDFIEEPRRPLDSHKGTFGHTVLIAGSIGYSGAAVLSARAAARARPGLVSVLTPEEAWSTVASQLVTPMVHPFSPAHRLLEGATALLVGPGLASDSIRDALRSEVERLWDGFPGPMVVDASALDWIPRRPARQGLRILTPHPGEAARLLAVTAPEVQADRVGCLRSIAQRQGAVVVLKGHQTLVGESTGPVFVNSSGNPGLAQGGTGDVLAGYLVGLLAQKPHARHPVQTCRRAAWTHGVAADRLERRCRNWTAEELAEDLGRA